MFSQWSFCSLNVVLMSKIRWFSKNNWTDCNFFIVLPIRLKTCRFNGFFFFTCQDVRARKIVPSSEVLLAHVNPIRIGRAICPGLSMLLYFHWENEINKVSSQVSFKLLMKLFWKQLFLELLSEVYLSAMELFCGYS